MSDDGGDTRSGDDFSAEVSDLRPAPGNMTPDRTASWSLLHTRLTARQRFARLAVTLAALALAAGVIWNASSIVGRQSSPKAPAPTLTSGPNTSLVYLLPNPPGVFVSLDGHPLASLPAPGDPHPLHLSAGTHTFDWVSKLLPFRRLECLISVPARAQDSCPIVPLANLPDTMSILPGAVIGMHDSLATLDPGADKLLTGALDQALAASNFTAIVQPGERYFALSQGQERIVVVQQPVRATLSYELIPSGGYSEPCMLSRDVVPCRFPGQDCSQLCTVASPPDSLTGGGDWVAAANVRATWRYTSLDGRTVVDTGTEIDGFQLMSLRVGWDGATWHVTPIVGHTPGFDAADDAVCDPARLWLSQSTWSFMLNNPPPSASTQFASGTNPAEGCVVVLHHGDPAVFIERFGVLLTVNDAARNPTDNMPVADASEQALAAQLMAQLQP